MTDTRIPMDLDEARQFINECYWTFAKTMPQSPHDYIVRGKVDAEKFYRFVELIRRDGVVRPWGRYRNIYLAIDGFNFWTMGAPVVETTIINRQLVEDFEKGMPK